MRRHFARRSPEAAERGAARARVRDEAKTSAEAGTAEAEEDGQSTDEEALDAAGEEAWADILQQMAIAPSTETIETDKAEKAAARHKRLEKKKTKKGKKGKRR